MSSHFVAGLMLCCLARSGSSESNKFRVDESGLAYVSHRDGEWRVEPRLVPWQEDPHVIARANFTNAQRETGWTFLEVQTRESADDALQGLRDVGELLNQLRHIVRLKNAAPGKRHADY